MKTLEEIAADLGRLVRGKREQYGDSITFTSIALAALFPQGVPPERQDDVLLIVRVLDKLQRLSTALPGDTESPWVDIAGYAICGIEQKLREEELQRVCASVSGAIASMRSPASKDSAPPPVETPTSASASSATGVSSPSASAAPSPSKSAGTDAPARIVTVDAYREAVDRAKDYNKTGLCGNRSTSHLLNYTGSCILQTVHGDIRFCSLECRLRFETRNEAYR